MKSIFIKVLFILACFSSILFFSTGKLQAQDDIYGVNDMNLHLEQNLQPREAIVGIINIALSFLGLIAVIIIIYGGFVWMTSGGEAEKVNKAKKILKNGLIGLIIVLLSWGIVTWLLGLFSDGDGTTTYKDPSQPPFDPGWGVIGSCTLESVYPEPNQKEVPRNTSIIITFKEALDPSSVCVSERGGDDPCDCTDDACDSWINPENIVINASHQESPLVNAKAQLTSDMKTILITPQEFLGTSNHYTNYIIKISGFLKDDGELMFRTCSNDWFEWTFEVSDIIDLTPPIVVSGGVFPPFDNDKDIKEPVDYKKASGQITVNDCPTAYRPASVLNSVPIGDSPPIENVSISTNYSGSYTNITLTAETGGQAQLKSSDDIPLGISTWQGNQISFPNFSNFTVVLNDSPQAGNQWTFNIQSRILADTLTVGPVVFSFTNDGLEVNSIAVPEVCNINTQVNNIRDRINNTASTGLVATSSPSVIGLEAQVGGSAGNSIILSTTNSSALEIVPMSGGQNEGVNYTTVGEPDQPRNTTIQINFNKPMNPITLSGSSGSLEDSIRVINEDTNEVIDGTFYISNNYRTVEFVSDFECGENGCGEKIYCLPEDANIKVELIAAPLKSCATNTDCAIFQPFINCSSSVFDFNICQDSDGNYLPTSDGFKGIMDTSFNSLDGNRDGAAKGPHTFYNENDGDESQGDNFKWSFFTSDEINLDPPIISSIEPAQGDANFNGEDDIIIEFDSLMRNSTLRTGSIFTTGPLGRVEHKRINLFSSADVVGYWIRTENIDDTGSGSPDYTKALINHSGLAPFTSWRSQVGSGVENIYQNCFKPSAGPGCAASDSLPSCCFGSPTDTLNIDGNCP